MYQRWNSFLEEFVKNNAHHMFDDVLTEELNKISGKTKFTKDAVRKKRQALGITKVSGRGYCQLKKKKGPKK